MEKQIQCKKCKSNNIVKAGFRRNKQSYLCKNCGVIFIKGDRRKGSIQYSNDRLCELNKIILDIRREQIDKYLQQRKIAKSTVDKPKLQDFISKKEIYKILEKKEKNVPSQSLLSHKGVFRYDY